MNVHIEIIVKVLSDQFDLFWVPELETSLHISEAERDEDLAAFWQALIVTRSQIVPFGPWRSIQYLPILNLPEVSNGCVFEVDYGPAHEVI